MSRIGEASLRRTLATMSVLGFSSPSFSFGMDIMLPVNVNQQLRDVLLSDPETVRGKGREKMKQDLQAIRALGKFHGVFVPEVRSSDGRGLRVEREERGGGGGGRERVQSGLITYVPRVGLPAFLVPQEVTRVLAGAWAAAGGGGAGEIFLWRKRAEDGWALEPPFLLIFYRILSYFIVGSLLFRWRALPCYTVPYLE